mmetsp:Transcript_59583/g.164694  ORF Transcript_59583/g.164694 Transcript_59583/m.164694 type:complete len:254 (+) Transcript_59583:157-918(+)
MDLPIRLRPWLSPNGRRAQWLRPAARRERSRHSPQPRSLAGSGATNQSAARPGGSQPPQRSFRRRPEPQSPSPGRGSAPRTLGRRPRKPQCARAGKAPLPSTVPQCRVATPAYPRLAQPMPVPASHARPMPSRRRARRSRPCQRGRRGRGRARRTHGSAPLPRPWEGGAGPDRQKCSCRSKPGGSRQTRRAKPKGLVAPAGMCSFASANWLGPEKHQQQVQSRPHPARAVAGQPRARTPPRGRARPPPARGGR